MHQVRGERRGRRGARRRCVEEVNGVGRWQTDRQLAFQKQYGPRVATGPFVAKIGGTEQAGKTHGTANQSGSKTSLLRVEGRPLWNRVSPAPVSHTRGRRLTIAVVQRSHRTLVARGVQQDGPDPLSVRPRQRQ